jgi:hypothetical protein
VCWAELIAEYPAARRQPLLKRVSGRQSRPP